MIRLASFVYVATLFMYGVPGSEAQEPAADPPAHVSFVDGTAVLERDGQVDAEPTSMPLLAGDRLRTENGRLEVLFADGSTLHLDHGSVVDFQSDDVIRLIQGRIRLNITGQQRAVHYRVDAPGGWVEITQAGEYRLALLARDGEVELAVLRGFAELVNENGRTSLRAGERAFARGGVAPSYAYVFNSAAWDGFDRWSEERRDRRLGVSAQYLPETVRPYAATFDRYGSWRHEPTYGYVWYPTVSVGWRPYYRGRWATLRPFGWTWIAHDPWGWPTHHYGRWGFSAGAWFWIPGRHWGPAWVSWAYAPGYVSWCPLGWNNRPVIQFVNVNVYGGRRHDPWHAWTVVPRGRFGRGFVHTNVVVGTRIDTQVRRSFVVRDAAPEHRGYAVPRASSAIYAAGTRRTGGPSGDGAVTGVAVPRTSISGSPAGARSEAERAAEVFRSRRGPGASTTGPGFPPAAREPRESAIVTDQPRAGTAVRRQSSAPTNDPPTRDRATVSRSRSNTDQNANDTGTRRLEVPGYRRAPSAPGTRTTQPVERSAPSAVDPARRAVPRRYESAPPAASSSPGDASSSRDRYARPDGYSRPDGPAAQPDRNNRRYSPDPSRGAPRATPREAPQAPQRMEMPQAPPQRTEPPMPRRESPPPPQYRSSPGNERRGPSGPPPAAAEPRGGRPSGGPPAEGRDGGRARQGGESTGRAVRRGGGR